MFTVRLQSCGLAPLCVCVCTRSAWNTPAQIWLEASERIRERERDRVAGVPRKRCLGGWDVITHISGYNSSRAHPSVASELLSERASERGFPFLQTGQTEILRERHAFLRPSFFSSVSPPPLCVCALDPLSKHISPIPYTSSLPPWTSIQSPITSYDPFRLHSVEVARHSLGNALT